MNPAAEIWEKVKALMGSEMTATTLNTWFDDSQAVALEENRFVLYSPSKLKRDIIAARYAVPIQNALHELFSADFQVTVLTEGELEGFQEGSRKQGTFLPGTEEYTFERFVVGSSNKFAHAAARKVADNPGESYNPLFIFGNSGLGKTHLLYSIAHTIHAHHPNYRIIYVKGDAFTNELVTAIREGRNQEFRDKYRGADVFLMDDVQFIAGRDSTQEEMFHTFNTLYESNKQIVLASDRPPKEIKTLEDRLRTRFEWGLLADIQTPDFETRIAIIRRKAQLMDISVPDDVSEYIANRLKTNIRQLEGAVKKLKAYKLLQGTSPSIVIAQNAIRDILNDSQPVPVTVERIIAEVGRTYGISPQDIRSTKRNAQISSARQISMYIVREITQMSMSMIGEEFGGRDHSTVVYATQQVEKNMANDLRYKETVEDIIKNIRDS